MASQDRLASDTPIRLLRTYLRRYKPQLVAVVVLQAAQTIAAVYLPSLNADIIDKGVARGDTGYIWSPAASRAFITLLQITCAASAVYFGAKAAMEFGRCARRDRTPSPPWRRSTRPTPRR